MNDSCSFPTENMLLFKLLTVSLNFFKLGGLSALNFVFLHKHFSTGKNLRGGQLLFLFLPLFLYLDANSKASSVFDLSVAARRSLLYCGVAGQNEFLSSAF